MYSKDNTGNARKSSFFFSASEHFTGTESGVGSASDLTSEIPSSSSTNFQSVADCENLTTSHDDNDTGRKRMAKTSVIKPPALSPKNLTVSRLRQKDLCRRPDSKNHSVNHEAFMKCWTQKNTHCAAKISRKSTLDSGQQSLLILSSSRRSARVNC